LHNIKADEVLFVVTPDEPGIFGRVLGTLANAGVNLRAISVHSEGKKGLFKLLTADNAKAAKALKTLGYKVTADKVFTAEFGDRIGAGAEIGALLGTAIIDIEYSFGSTAGTGNALLVFKTSNNKKAVKTLS
jgi:hypothetical protein